MKFIVSSGLLLKNLQSIGGILSTKNNMPILGDFLMEISGNTLKMTASDLETTMISEMELDMSEGDGMFAVPAKMLLDVLKTFADVPITFIVDEETQQISLSVGEGHYSIAGHNGDEYPKIPEFGGTDTVTLSSSTLLSAISTTLFATSTEELRPSITGVLFDITPEEIIFVATDAHKLVKYTKKGHMSDSVTSFIVPKKPLNQLKSILMEDETDILIEYNKTNVTFTFGHYKMYSRLINAPFPNYQMIIPKDNHNNMVIDKDLLEGTMRRISLFANKANNQVSFNIKNGEIVITGEDISLSNKAQDRLVCEYQGDEILIGFNSRIFLDLLNHIEAKMIKVELSQPTRPAVILPIEDSEEESDEKYIMLISPVMLNN